MAPPKQLGVSLGPLTPLPTHNDINRPKLMDLLLHRSGLRIRQAVTSARNRVHGDEILKSKRAPLREADVRLTLPQHNSPREAQTRHTQEGPKRISSNSKRKNGGGWRVGILRLTDNI